MHLPDRHMRAWVSPLLGGLLLLEALFLPGLERGEGTRRAVLESEHSTATCVVGHDHTICIQTGANRAAKSDVVSSQLPVVSPSTLHQGPATSRSTAPVELAGNPPRGPPDA